MTPGRPSPPFLLLVMLTAASPFAMNALLPAMPALARRFHAPYSVIQLTLTLALVAFGVSQLVLGPLSDRLGRRPVMIWGIALFLVGSVISAVATSASVLIAGRVVQATGGAAGLVLSRTILHDVYGRDRAASAIGYATMAMMVAPMLAPYIGGWLSERYGWQAIFWMMAALGAMLLVATVAFLVETHEVEAGSDLGRRMLRDGLELVRIRKFWSYAGNMAFGAGMFFAFCGGAPYIVEELMHRPPTEYAIDFVVVSIGYFIGNLLSARIGSSLGPHRMILWGMVVAVLGIALLWLLAGWSHPMALFLPMALVALSNGMTLPSAMVGAMSIEARLAGSAAGIAGAFQMAVAALLSGVVGAYLETSSWPMILGMTLSGALACASLLLGALPARERPAPEVTGG